MSTPSSFWNLRPLHLPQAPIRFEMCEDPISCVVTFLPGWAAIPSAIRSRLELSGTT